jgi:hypothetical protein
VRLISPAATALVLVACGSFGSASEPETLPDGGPGSDAAVVDGAALEGGALPPADGPVQSVKTCANYPDAIVCADFEGQSPFFGWEEKNETTGSQVLTAPDPGRGGTVMRAVLAPGPPVATAQLARPLPETTAAAVFVRAYVRFDAPLTDTDYHILIVLSNIEIGIEKGGLIVNRFGAGAQTFYEAASKPFPIGKWACVQWALDADSTMLSVDGELVHSKMAPMDIAQNLIVGLRHTTTTTAVATVSFDDLVVSKRPIGCD